MLHARQPSAHAGARVVIHIDGAALAQLHAQLLKAQVVGVGAAACGRGGRRSRRKRPQPQASVAQPVVNVRCCFWPSLLPASATVCGALCQPVQLPPAASIISTNIAPFGGMQAGCPGRCAGGGGGGGGAGAHLWLQARGRTQSQTSQPRKTAGQVAAGRFSRGSWRESTGLFRCARFQQHGQADTGGASSAD